MTARNRHYVRLLFEGSVPDCRVAGDTLSDTPDHFELIGDVAPGALECLDFAGSCTGNGGQGSGPPG